MKPRSFVLSLGTNSGGEPLIVQARQLIEAQLGAIRMSRVMQTEPIGISSPPFLNAMAVGCTTLTAAELRAVLKKTERMCGDTRELRRQNVIMLDIDLLQLGSRSYKPEDWQRDYIQELSEELGIEIVNLKSGNSK